MAELTGHIDIIRAIKEKIELVGIKTSLGFFYFDYNTALNETQIIISPMQENSGTKGIGTGGKGYALTTQFVVYLYFNGSRGNDVFENFLEIKAAIEDVIYCDQITIGGRVYAVTSSTTYQSIQRSDIAEDWLAAITVTCNLI